MSPQPTPTDVRPTPTDVRPTPSADPAGTRSGPSRAARRITGFTPSGHLHLGNYFGAIRPMVPAEPGSDPMVFVSDLHAMTSRHDPAELAAQTTEVVTLLLASGLDPQRCTFFVQSHVPEHVELHYLLECTTTYGEAHRMIQFKEKGAGQPSVRLSLLTYPVLMAADILVYDIEEVPVGEDQTQHVELARDVAGRFNHRYGPIFALPRAVNPPFASRVMDLSDPTTKMSKSSESDAGVLRLLDPPDVIRRKVKRAVTDTGREVRYDRGHQPGIANLLDILAATRPGTDPADLARGFDSYGALKSAVVEAVLDLLGPLQARYRQLAAEPGVVRDVLRDGAGRARERAAIKVAQARAAMGLLPA